MKQCRRVQTTYRCGIVLTAFALSYAPPSEAGGV
jgi:hypothetical protein